LEFVLLTVSHLLPLSLLTPGIASALYFENATPQIPVSEHSPHFLLPFGIFVSLYGGKNTVI
jgi:hypothetical protein